MRRYFHYHSWRFKNATENDENVPDPNKNGKDYKKIFIFVFIGTVIIALVSSLFAAFYRIPHEHEYSVKGYSTTTCQTLGETTYWCVYRNDSYHNCQKKLVLKDTTLADCKYSIIETISEKLSESTYRYECVVCKGKKVETVKNTYGSYDTARILDDSNGNDYGEFTCWITAGTTSASKLDKMRLKAVLFIFDKNENKFYEEEKSFTFTSNGLRILDFKVKSSIMSNYYLHRWALIPQ